MIFNDSSFITAYPVFFDEFHRSVSCAISQTLSANPEAESLLNVIFIVIENDRFLTYFSVHAELLQ